MALDVAAGRLREVQVRTFKPKVSIVVPTYNEARNLPHVFSRLPGGLHEVILVDGLSIDDTVAVARALRPDVRVVRQNRCGKGNALACGFESVTGDIIVMLDADGSADPGEIPRYIAALVAGADFAKGTRFAHGGGSGDITPTRAWGNRWLNRAVNVLFGTRYTDLCYGYNAFWTHCLPVLELDATNRGSTNRLWGDGFEIETIINTRVAKAGLQIAEVPSYEARRLYGQSNLNTWRDGIRVLRALIVERLNRRGVGHVVVRLPTDGRETPFSDATPRRRPPQRRLMRARKGPMYLVQSQSAQSVPFR
jgi:glycosyltransferase involved in cell wall biosynthesis